MLFIFILQDTKYKRIIQIVRFLVTKTNACFPTSTRPTKKTSKI